MKVAAFSIIFGLALGSVANAALIASDSAADSAYDSGWVDGSNGGSGFGPWSLSVSIPNGDRNGIFTGSSANNGSSPSGNIDSAGRAWGMYANGSDGVLNALAVAYRPFTGSLSVGQTLTLAMDNGFIDSTYMVGFSLMNADPATPIPFGALPNSNTRFSFSFTGGGTTYALTLGDGMGGTTMIDTGVGFTDGGLSLAFTLLAGDQYAFSVNGGTPFTGSLGGQSGEALNGIALFNYRAGEGSSNDAFFNSLAIIPEPGTGLLVGLGLLGLAVRRRRG